jgi:carbonic anhydrase
MSSRSLTPAQALQKLKQGNAEYAAGRGSGNQADDSHLRKEFADKQEPFAVVISCSDSRVPSERVFNLALGDLFIVRNAGNTVVDTASLGSVQYAVAVLGVPLVLVMGHERCGAVRAATDVVTNNVSFPGSIGRMIEPILPSVLRVREHDGDLVENAVRENVRRMVAFLRTDPIIAEPLKSRSVIVVGARFDLDDGVVEFLGEA